MVAGLAVVAFAAAGLAGLALTAACPAASDCCLAGLGEAALLLFASLQGGELVWAETWQDQ
jgi:hypothetical protein